MEQTFAVFDFDGTIADTMGVWANIHRGIFKQYNIKLDIPQYQNEINGMPYIDCARYTVNHYPTNLTAEQLLEKWFSVATDACEKCSFVTNCDKHIQQIHSQNVKIGIATASPVFIVEAFFKNRQDIRKCISEIVSCEDVKKSKPAPDVYLECMRRLGCTDPLQCAIYEDSVVGLKGAQNAKCGKTIAILIENEDDFELKKNMASQSITDYNALQMK